jgi:hypothetical protein
MMFDLSLKNRLFLRYDESVNDVNPSEDAVNDGPEDRFVPAPGYEHCDKGA